MSVNDVLLRVEGLSRRRGAGSDGFRIEVPSFVVVRGACLALTGASGSGKSTMLDLLGLVLRPDRAERFEIVDHDGLTIDVARLWRTEDRDGLAMIRSRLIGYVLQTGGLLPFLSAADNIRLSRRLLGMAGEDELVERLIGALGIDLLLAKKPRALSVGERQRVAIARALAHRPTLLLADEPTAALDPLHAVRVMELLLELVRELRVTAIIVTHDWDLVRTLGLQEVRAQPLPTDRGSATRFAC